MKLTKTHTRESLKNLGFSVKWEDQDVLISQKGKRTCSYRATSNLDAITKAKELSENNFNSALEKLDNLNEIYKDALREWHLTYRAQWSQKLQSAWYTGNYSDFRNSNVSSTLQKLRNHEVGYEVVEQINKLLK